MGQKRTMQMGEIKIAYVRLGETVGSKRLFIPKVNIAIARNITRLEQEMKNIGKQQEAIVDRYVLKKKDGQPETKKAGEKEVYIFATMEKEDSYTAAMSDLEKAEFDIEIETIKYEDLIDQAERYDEPTAADLVAMETMMEE